MKRFACINDIKLYNILRNNPHTIQFFCGVDKIYTDQNPEYTEERSPSKIYYYYSRDFKPPSHKQKLIERPNYKNPHIPRKITDLKTEFKYVARKQLPSTTLHWGQLKLLICEMDFFQRYLDPKKKYTIVYAGAALGTHTLISLSLYQNFFFVLIDPRDFEPRLYTHKRVRIINDYFSDSLAHELKKKYDNIIYITDIRAFTGEEEDIREQNIRDNQMMQKGWYDIMQPEYSLLKFRLPWDIDTFDYLEGEIYMQPFAPVTSTETRLVVKKNAKMITYDCKNYEDKLFYFNIIDMGRYYDHTYDINKLYMDHCYDCTVSMNVLRDYLNSDFNIKFKDYTPEKLMKYIIDFLSFNNENRNKLKRHYIEILENLTGYFEEEEPIKISI